MPRKVLRKVERHAAVVKNLQNNICEDRDPNITAGRYLTIERWAKIYMREIEYLKDNELQFLYNVFKDDRYWSGTRLNNKELGRRFTENIVRGGGDSISNPLSLYNMACRYCVTDRIDQLFFEEIKSYSESFSDEEVDKDGKCVSSDSEYVRNELLKYMKSQDPVFSFWISSKSGKLKEREGSAAENSFDKAVEFEWGEGVEYFYGLLREEDKKKKIAKVVADLSSIQCSYGRAVILDFCLDKMDIEEKKKLLTNRESSELFTKGKGIYPLLSSLVRQGFFDTAQGIFSILGEKVLEEKVFLPQDYALLLSSFSDMLLKNHKNPHLSTKCMDAIADLLRSGDFNNLDTGREAKAAVFSRGSGALVSINHAIAALFVDWQRSVKEREIDSVASTKKNQILEVFGFAKALCSNENFAYFRKSIVNHLKAIDMDGMYDDVYYDELAEELFSSDPRFSLVNPKVSGHSDGKFCRS